MSSTRIFVAAHKASRFPDDPGYVPLQVGRAIATEDLGILGDDGGHTISALNPFYCECTALYWMTRNAVGERVGLAHYRRFFVPRRRGLRFGGAEIAAADDFDEELAAGVELIVPSSIACAEPDEPGQTVEQQYAVHHVGFDLILAREAVAELFPDYLPAFDFVMRGTQLTPFNMFVGQIGAVRAYDRWLFAILFRLQRQIPFDLYDDYQRRVFGFLAERLFPVWIGRNWGSRRIAFRDTLTEDLSATVDPPARARSPDGGAAS